MPVTEMLRIKFLIELCGIQPEFKAHIFLGGDHQYFLTIKLSKFCSKWSVWQQKDTFAVGVQYLLESLWWPASGIFDCHSLKANNK